MSFVIPSSYRILPSKWEVNEPFQVDTSGEVGFTSNPADWAKNHILALLLTSPGERVMRPTYGTGLRKFLFENNDPLVIQSMVAQINTALQTYEPGITLINVSVVQMDQNNGLVEIRIDYQLRNQGVTLSTTVTVSQ